MQITGAVLETSGAEAPFARSRPFTVGPLELDPPGPGELLVRIEAAGVCHSDLSVVDGNRRRPTPMLLGHEASGIVEQVGDGVTDVAPGTRVVMTFLPRCGDCPECASDGRLPCRTGSAANGAGTLVGGGIRLHRDGLPVHHHLGVSAFASHAVVSRTSVVPVDDDVPAEIAALLGCAVLTGGGAIINAGRPAPGSRVTIVGLGGVGMAALLVAVALGHEVIGVDALPAKLEAALSLGAAAAYAPDEALRAASDARTGSGNTTGNTGTTGNDTSSSTSGTDPADAAARAPLVIEAAGSARAFETAFALTAPGGTTVTVGLPAPDARADLSPLTLTAEARTVIGSYLGSAVPARDIPRYVELWRAGRLPLERLVSSRIRLDELDTAMDRLAAGGELRQLITLD
ncbi:alcohol dehydrogenase catalytic domain-containing protein [Agromyces salentinus]|uniref:Zinc-dependent alcohol dehydrogenase family protein n=1 Tax=Agromyces salentinus TaxID=269421 RepID=A0ABN2MNX9_9MICO|nr:alcohol dehydrogenase catalytic domain-containing protein [Agromyces salentinus]